MFADDEPTIFGRGPCNDGHVHIGLPDGVCDGGAGRGDVKADFFCCGGEEFQWVARGAEGIVDGLGGAFAVKRNIGERREVSDRQDVGVAVGYVGRARGRGVAHAVRGYEMDKEKVSSRSDSKSNTNNGDESDPFG